MDSFKVAPSEGILQDKQGNVKFYLVDGHKRVLCLDGWKSKDNIDINYPPLLFPSRQEANFYIEKNDLIGRGITSSNKFLDIY